MMVVVSRHLLEVERKAGVARERPKKLLNRLRRKIANSLSAERNIPVHTAPSADV